MPDQIILAWKVNVAGSSFGPAEAAAALAAVELYDNQEVDPVLGQLFGLGVATDATTSDATSATRTLTLNMTSAGGEPFGPPAFQCHPRTTSPPQEPDYRFVKAVELAGSFFVENGMMTVNTTDSQIPSLSVGDEIQFLAQPGVSYFVSAIGATTIDLLQPYSGTTSNSGAFKEVADPVALDRAAVYSTSPLDTAGVATTPAIPAGPGARTLAIEFLDSTGAGPFSATATLTGKRPALLTIVDPGAVDIAEIVSFSIATVGGFGNSVGQITLVALSDDLPAIPTGTAPGTGIGSIEGTARAVGLTNTFTEFTDEAQLLIDRHLVYMPPSYFALAQQGAAVPMLEGDFLVTTNSKEVTTTEDQTAALAATNKIEFASQPGVLYEVGSVSAKIVRLTTVYTGIDTNYTGANNVGTNSNAGTKGNIGDAVQRFPTGARLIDPSPATPPTNTELSGPLAQFVAPTVAQPPLNPPLQPGTIPTPSFLSNLFTRTIVLALRGARIEPQAITFA